MIYCMLEKDKALAMGIMRRKFGEVWRCGFEICETYRHSDYNTVISFITGVIVMIVFNICICVCIFIFCEFSALFLGVFLSYVG